MRLTVPVLCASFLCAVGVLTAAPRPAAPAGLARKAPPLPSPAGEVVRVADESALQAAVAALHSGQTILIEPGEYHLSRTLVLDSLDRVALRGATGRRDEVVLVGEGLRATEKKIGSLIQVAGCRDLLLADLTLSGAWWHCLHVAGERGAVGTRVYNVHFLDGKEQMLKVNPGYHPTVFPDSGTVEYCRFEFSDRAAQRYTAGVDILGAAGWCVRDCDFIRIRGPEPDSLCDAAVMFWQHCRDLTVERCWFYECDFGIWVGLGDGYKFGKRDPGTAFDIIGARVRNNMIFRRESGDTGISLHRARDFEVCGNTVLLNGTYPACVEYRFAGTAGLLRANLTDGPLEARDGAVGELAGNVTTAEPAWFVDSLAGDLHLRPEALAALRAAGLTSNLTEDFDGEPRPAGPNAAGADEGLAQ